jgi:IS30 family transposase
MYKHLNLNERFTLAVLLNQGYDQRDIAESLGRSPCTISRELRRNCKLNGIYGAQYANKAARLIRKKSKVNSRKIENNKNLEKRISKKLHPLVSPEVISHDENVCIETIYAWIYRSRPDLKIKLPQKGKKRRRYGFKRGKKQGWTRDVRNLSERPKGAENRSRLGHFEGDTVKLEGGAFLTHTDRKSRFERVHLMKNEESGTAQVVIENDGILKRAKTITYDRGSTFAIWRDIEKNIGTKIFFANARHPWERGTNENANGRLRRIFPKGTKYSDVTQEMIDETVNIMNNTKRKCLGWRTPKQVFYGRCTSK